MKELSKEQLKRIPEFEGACKLAGVQPTRRQLHKFLRFRGQAFRKLKAGRLRWKGF